MHQSHASSLTRTLVKTAFGDNFRYRLGSGVMATTTNSVAVSRATRLTQARLFTHSIRPFQHPPCSPFRFSQSRLFSSSFSANNLSKGNPTGKSSSTSEFTAWWVVPTLLSSFVIGAVGVLSYSGADALVFLRELTGSTGGESASAMAPLKLINSINNNNSVSRNPPYFGTVPTRFEKQRITMLTDDQVDERLRSQQSAFKAPTSKGSSPSLIQGYSLNQVASNNPIEDDSSRHVVRAKDPSVEGDQTFFGVFDGHGGWCCSQRVALELAPSVAKELAKVQDRTVVKEVVEAIEQGFLKLDHEIVHDTVAKVLENPSRPLACSSLLPAIAGSCALLAYVDHKGNDLYVACTGDSRAVMGVTQQSPDKNGSHSWKAVPLSFDQTGRNKWEVKRLQAEHPGEEDTVVMRGRVLGGLEPTRAFGDARYKWSKEIQEKVFNLFPTYRQPHRNYHTPPYVTAKPVVRHHKLSSEDRFLVMATDGLWDKLTSDEVIQLVGQLVDGKIGQEKHVLDRSAQKSDELTPTNLAPKGPPSQVRQFIFKDQSNPSTHLVRNALGGGDQDSLAATLSIPSPMSRVYRDDITVTVIFFNQQDAERVLTDARDHDGFVEISV